MREAFAVPTAALAAAFPLLTATPVLADHDGSYQTTLGAWDDPGVSGAGMVTRAGDQATATVEPNGVLADHRGRHRRGQRPGRRPLPDPDGDSCTHDRTFTIDRATPESFAAGTAVLVVHGIDVSGNGTYDAEAGQNSLDPSLPLEATAPAACGACTACQMGQLPTGGAETGAGSTSAIDEMAAIGAGPSPRLVRPPPASWPTAAVRPPTRPDSTAWPGPGEHCLPAADRPRLDQRPVFPAADRVFVVS